MNNTTILSLQQSREIELLNTYDSVGAIIFIVVILLWYSSSIVFLLGMQTISPTEIVEDSSRHSRKLFTHNFHEKSNNKKILEELVDKGKRDKLWDIYLGTSGDMNDKITRAETLRIRNIQRQLATINEHHQNDNEQVQLFNNDNSLDFNIVSSVPDIPSCDSRIRVRRQSSIDQQILEDWKTTVDGLKVSETWPWTIQRLLIRRHLRRQQRVKDYRSLRKSSIP